MSIQQRITISMATTCGKNASESNTEVALSVETEQKKIPETPNKIMEGPIANLIIGPATSLIHDVNNDDGDNETPGR
jgi:hypothetical protein